MSAVVCNANGCKTILLDKGYASTDCLHCFCKPHAQEYLNKSNTCPVCDMSAKLFTVVFTDPFDENVLIGQTPKSILEAVDLATSFLLTQSSTNEKKSKAQLQLFASQAQQMQSGFKAKLAQANQQNQLLKTEVTRRQAETANLRKEISDVKEQYARLRDQFNRKRN